MKANYAIIGAGIPGRGMGWFHALQIINGNVNSSRLTDVVEDYFLGEGSDTPSGEIFKDEVVEPWSKKGVRFHQSVQDLWLNIDGPKIALIAGRTADNPRLFYESIHAGADCILLEKPGAATVEELTEMSVFADEKKIPVYMGFIKNLSDYFISSYQLCKKQGGEMMLISKNSYKREELGECFQRNSEGLLKNMAIHELALAVQFFGMKADNILSVEIHSDNCECLTLEGITDFSKVDFTLNNGAQKIRIYADRCAGDSSFVKVFVDQKEISSLDLNGFDKEIQEKFKKHPDYLPYLITQEQEYKILKERVAQAVLHNSPPENVATVEVGIEALKLAEFLTPYLQGRIQ